MHPFEVADLYLLSPELSLTLLALVVMLVDLFTRRRIVIVSVALIGLIVPVGLAISLALSLDPSIRPTESRAWTAVRTSSRTGISVNGRTATSSTGAAERWLAGSNLRSDSTSSPKSSIRTGRSNSGG